jgi:hypothetical protein
MKKIIYFAYFIFLTQSFAVLAEENLTTLCLRTMQSFSAIGLQLKHSPDLKIEDLNNMADKQTNNPKLKEFLKLQLIPRILDKNAETINAFIRSKEAINQCELLVSKN